MPPRTTKRRTTTNLKKQPELPENQTAWKSDNQGVKEEAIIQTSRRGREDLWQGGGSWTQRGGELWSRVGKAAAGSKAAAGGPGDIPRNPGLQHGEIMPQTTD